MSKPALFIKNSIIFTASILILVNIINFDFVIYHYSKATTGEGVDYTYLSRLSADSLSYKEQFKVLETYTIKNINKRGDYDNDNPLILLRNIENLQNKYSDLDVRTVSLLEYFQYRKIRSLDTSQLREHYESQNRFIK